MPVLKLKFAAARPIVEHAERWVYRAAAGVDTSRLAGKARRRLEPQALQGRTPQQLTSKKSSS